MNMLKLSILAVAVIASSTASAADYRIASMNITPCSRWVFPYVEYADQTAYLALRVNNQNYPNFNTIFNAAIDSAVQLGLEGLLGGTISLDKLWEKINRALPYNVSTHGLELVIDSHCDW